MENTRSDPQSTPRKAWPAELAYQAWRMRFVRVAMAALVLAALFAAGVLYGVRRGGHEHADVAVAADAGDEILYWTCSMHPQVKLPGPGQCPICFMDLIPVRADDGQDADTDAPQLRLSRRARQLARVQTSPVERKFVEHELNLVGRVMPDETAITYVSSYVPGRLDRLFVDYTGILVRRGDHLAEIYSPELLVAQQEFLTALNNLERTGRNSGQSSLMTGTGEAMLQAARRKLELWGIPDDEIETLARTRQPREHIRIDAPLEGWVLERQGFQGMYVDTGTRIFTLADLRTVWVLLDAYELDVGFVRAGQEVQFEAEALPGQTFTAQVSYIDPVLDPATRTVKVRLVVSNPDLRLKPDMFVRARLKATLGEGGAVAGVGLAGKWMCPMHPEVISDAPGECDKCGMDLETAESLGYAATGEPVGPALAVPQTAVLLTGKRAVVYVEFERDGEPVYEGRTVQLGPRAGEHYIVTAGLEEGERVVTRGALMIDSALQIRAEPSMMQPPDLVEEEPEMASRYVAGAMYLQHMEPMIDAYLTLTASLADDDAEGAARAAANLASAVRGAEPHGLEDDEDQRLFDEQVSAIDESVPATEHRNIDELRSALPQLTSAVELYLRTFGHERDEPVVKAFCPMAFDDEGAAWLQAGEQINNPYFGAQMLRCGEVRGTIEPDGEWNEAQ